jgi:hypothetical protein
LLHFRACNNDFARRGRVVLQSSFTHRLNKPRNLAFHRMQDPLQSSSPQAPDSQQKNIHPLCSLIRKTLHN